MFYSIFNRHNKPKLIDQSECTHWFGCYMNSDKTWVFDQLAANSKALLLWLLHTFSFVMLGSMYSQFCLLLLFYSLLFLYCNWISVNKWTWTDSVKVPVYIIKNNQTLLYVYLGIDDIGLFLVCRFVCNPDHYTHTSVIAKTLSLYLSLLDESYIKKLSACIKSDCSHWLSKLFG